MSTIIPQSELLGILAVPAQNLASAENFYFIIIVKKDFPDTSYYSNVRSCM